LNKSFEERVRFVWLALEFGMILTANKIRVIAQLDQFGEGAIRRCPRNHKALSIHSVAIFHVEFVAVPMPLRYLGVAVDFFRQCACNDLGWPCAQPHTCTFVTNAALLFQQ
jgi:hypothetical protein